MFPESFLQNGNKLLQKLETEPNNDIFLKKRKQQKKEWQSEYYNSLIMYHKYSCRS